MSTSILSRVLALALMIGATATVSLTPAHAVDGDTAARRCIDNDACHISPPNADGSFTLVFDDGGVIYCPGLDGECVVVSPDTSTGKGNPRGPIVAAPISTIQPPRLPGPVTGSNPTGAKPIDGKPITVVPVGVKPIPVTKPIGVLPSAPKGPVILLTRRGR